IVLDLGKEDCALFRPGQPRSVGQPKLSLPCYNRHNPRIPFRAGDCCVCDPRAIRGKYRAHFLKVIPCELHWLAFGQYLDIDLPKSGKDVLAANKGQHSSIWRESRLSNGVKKVRQLQPDRAVTDLTGAALPENRREGQG